MPSVIIPSPYSSKDSQKRETKIVARNLPSGLRSRLQLHHSVLLLLRVGSVGLLFEIDTDPLALSKELLPIYVWTSRYGEGVLNSVPYGVSGIPILPDLISVDLGYIIDKRGDSFH